MKKILSNPAVIIILAIILISITYYITVNSIKENNPRILTLSEYEIGYLPEENKIFLVNRNNNALEFILPDSLCNSISTIILKNNIDYFQKITKKSK